MSQDSGRDANEILKEQPFVAHLLELRDRLLRAVGAVAVLFLALFYFANDIYLFVAAPLMAHLPQGTTMIATEVASPFLTPFKLTLMVSIFLAMPFILYQFWAFIAPGLYKHEKRMVVPLVVSSTILYYTGMAFAYFVVFPLVFAFLIGATPDGVTVATDIAKYLDFVLTLFFAFGVAFEIPIATILLVWMGMTTPESLREKRPYVVVGVFVIGMLLTPPDVISQTLLAVPMWLLFEAGILFSTLFVRKQDEGDEDATDAGDAPQPPAPRPGGGPPAAAAAGPGYAGHDYAPDPERYTPLTPEELDQELDAIEEEEARQANAPNKAAADGEDPISAASTEGNDPITAKLREVQELRACEDEQGARDLLYEVLAEGNEDQRNVARNILRQLDD